MAEKKKRRRGAELETAILTAAWDQLQAKGYHDLTIEGVAAAAATTKTVLYRRWPDKARLVIAALSKFGEMPSYQGVDTGSLRGDLLNLFGQMAAVLAKLRTGTLRGILADRLDKLDLGQLMGKANTSHTVMELIQPMLDRAAARGEIASADQPDRVVTLPGVLLINEVIGQRQLTVAAQVAIVDEILLPVFQSVTAK
ncbi:TetR/AcrR family transcriptional regulator [Levilactobacillus humaensis]|uniref:TetR/AcrR family transcriptional regulator n=1 Tax=Levilactobacillus humaensis TaxID=2950375 RepID=UPI0021C37D51|nr:TetR/AcrR family transcriptional regulator [Levilactobacillus humaensis]